MRVSSPFPVYTSSSDRHVTDKGRPFPTLEASHHLPAPAALYCKIIYFFTHRAVARMSTLLERGLSLSRSWDSRKISHGKNLRQCAPSPSAAVPSYIVQLHGCPSVALKGRPPWHACNFRNPFPAPRIYRARSFDRV